MAKSNILIFLDNNGSIIEMLSDKKAALYKEKKSYISITKSKDQYHTTITRLKSFIDTDVKPIITDDIYVDLNIRIEELKDTVDIDKYKKLINDIYDIVINNINRLIDVVSDTKKEIVQDETDDIQKLTDEIKQIALSVGIEFSYLPVDHTSTNTIWSGIHENIESKIN